MKTLFSPRRITVFVDTFYTPEELESLGLKDYGTNVKISRKCSIYSPDKVVLGDNVRIDDFCLLSGEIALGSFIHIGAYSALYGQCGIEMGDFSGLSARVTIYTVSDDYGGECLTNPMVPDKYRKNKCGRVVLGKHALVGAGSIVLPGVTLAEGAAVGAMSLVLRDLEPWTMYFGIPCRKTRDRSKRALQLEEELRLDLRIVL